ncbi:hypothetical protein P7K49_021592 [Saguinus oedipus]|uniref:Uncharacterized protein n=1 Tax=Saguinus oedipus TaxID=9490 RepID=A0ABQ9UT31_SAGOE|nr:hypothetical protein P7K49_021592 [Saguinus oedipus]
MCPWKTHECACKADAGRTRSRHSSYPAGTEEDEGMEEEPSPFRGRSRSAPPNLWAAQRYGRELRRMSDEFVDSFKVSTVAPRPRPSALGFLQAPEPSHEPGFTVASPGPSPRDAPRAALATKCFSASQCIDWGSAGRGKLRLCLTSSDRDGRGCAAQVQVPSTRFGTAALPAARSRAVQTVLRPPRETLPEDRTHGARGSFTRGPGQTGGSVPERFIGAAP